MAAAGVVPVIAPDVTGQPPLHEWAERARGRGLQHQMEMVRHEAKCEEAHREAGLGRGEKIEEGPVVAVLVKDRGPPIAAVEDVRDIAGEQAVFKRKGSEIICEGDSTSKKEEKRWVVVSGLSGIKTPAPFGSFSVFEAPPMGRWPGVVIVAMVGSVLYRIATEPQRNKGVTQPLPTLAVPITPNA